MSDPPVHSDPTAPPSDELSDRLPLDPTQLDGWPPYGATGATLEQIRIGNYELRRLIAVGGMGSVYEAVQDQPRRVVALKILRAALPSPAAVKRFEKEAQLLARLQHPGIAQVIEAGTHERGGRRTPYIAMEYVGGARPITVYADAQRLDRRARLALFAEVCDAVHHGHARGVIHRDLKPSNILVDQSGRAKVIDFGVSRTIDADPASYTVAMESGQLIGTLQYMAPEQCDRAADAGTGADVYALGVVLYELLTGRVPYDVLATSLAEAVRVIREQPPRPPSQVDRSLRGDLETVVLTALHKSPQRRYASAAALGEDVRRFLAGDPIGARRDSVGYLVRARVRKFVARHQVSSFAGACVIAVLFAQTVGAFLYNFTPMHRAYENWLLASRLSPPPATQLNATRLVTLREGTDVEALARRYGVEGVTVADPTSLRRLHGKLMRVLADSGARVVAFDISFEGVTTHDEAFVIGVRALQATGIDVVIVTKRMTPGANGSPLLSPTFAGKVKWGGDGAGLLESVPWHLLLFAQVPASPEPLPGFALATLAAFRQPGADLAIYVNALANRTELRYVKRSVSEDLLSGDVLETTVNDPAFGLPAGTLQGEFLLNVPPKEVIAASNIDYADVLGADPEQLKKWFDGRAVVVGDRRPEGGDGPFDHPVEGPLPGCYAQAVGIDALIAGQGVVVLDTSFPQGLLIACTAALAGALAALAARGSGRKLVVFLAGLAVAAVAGSCLAYARARYLYNPLVPILAMVAAALLAAAATSFRRRVLG